jgi:hypothetical protein
MKNALLACGVLPLFLSPIANAGINGTYRVTGTEKENGKNYPFTGTVVVSRYKSGTYSLRFNDGDSASFKFTFNKALKDKIPSQTVSGASSIGTGSATFRYVNGGYKLKFDYKAKGANVSGSGSGSK